jgi:transglutaminase-like putative cysteine protease
MEITQVVEVVQSRGDYLIASSEPVRVEMPVLAESLVRPQQQVAEENRPVLEPMALRTSMIPGKTYQVTSSVSIADADSLRKASTDYPADVRSRYTRLPAIPQRVRDLAAELTAGSENPYDKARAIETYLRTLPYSLDIAPPPPDRDGVDYFLFDVKAGYCDYYASAMAVMSRSVGVPARVVTGYATGSRDSIEEPFVVRDSNAHSWVEVYFPTYGWVEFEPSSYRPVIEHLGAFDATGLEFTGDFPVEGDYLPFDYGYDFASMSPFGSIFAPDDGTGPLRVAGLLAGVVGLAAGVGYGLWRFRLRGLAPVPATYARVVTFASLLGVRPAPGETPIGYAHRLGERSPDVRHHLSRIADSYTLFRWSRSHDANADASALARAWHEVRRGLMAAVPARVRGRLKQ